MARVQLGFLPTSSCSIDLKALKHPYQSLGVALLTPDTCEWEQRTYLTIVKQNSERLLSTLNDVLDLSRIEAGQITVSASDGSRYSYR
jgi:signal transduction histidine kinase